MAHHGCSGRLSKLTQLAACCALAAALAYGEAPQNQPAGALQTTTTDPLTTAINEVKNGNFAYIQQIIAEAGEARAIPILQEIFSTQQDADAKEFLAAARYKAGRTDAIYWNYLFDQATLAAEAPLANVTDSSGKAVPQQLSPGFVAWANEHHLSYDAVYLLPGRLLVLSQTGDPRAIPVLRKALTSPNPFVRNMAAMGLAKLQDKASIPQLIESCKKDPSSAGVMGRALVCFDDPTAQQAAETCLSTDMYKALHEYRLAHETCPF